MKTQYYKHPNNCLFEAIAIKKNITVKLFDFDTSINISTIKTKLIDSLVPCSKIEFDKAFHLALALIINKETNKDDH